LKHQQQTTERGHAFGEAEFGEAEFGEE